MKKREKGFTLIELLVVVAIIGILAAVGVVAYNGYTKSAKINAAKSNQGQVVKYLAAEIQKCNMGTEDTAMSGGLDCTVSNNASTISGWTIGSVLSSGTGTTYIALDPGNSKVRIGAKASLADGNAGVHVGPGSYIRACVVLGANSKVGANSVLGHDGFGFEKNSQGVLGPVQMNRIHPLLQEKINEGQNFEVKMNSESAFTIWSPKYKEKQYVSSRMESSWDSVNPELSIESHPASIQSSNPPYTKLHSSTVAESPL